MADANCPRCGGTGWKLARLRRPAAAGKSADPPGAGGVAVPCDCTAGDREARILNRARIPRRYEHCDFANFESDLQHESSQAAAWNGSLEQAKLLVEGFARDYPLGIESGLLLMGPCGVGKTHLAVAALKQIILRGHEGLFYDYRELLKEIQGSYNPESQSSEMSVLEPVLKAELLLLDDLGASKPSAWALETLGHILNSRYNERRITLLTTNYLDGAAPSEQRFGTGESAPRDLRFSGRLPSGQAVAAAREEALAERVGQRIRSRLYEMCRTVEIVASDYRREVRHAGRVRS